MGIAYGQAPLLDLYSGALYAYSLRRLRSGTYPDSMGVFHKNIIRIKRLSDDAEADLDFKDILSGQAQLFCDGSTGVVTKWYDQSGNGLDSVGTTPPTIVSSGAAVVENGKAAISFDGVDDFMTAPSAGLTGVFPKFTLGIFKRSNNNQSIGRMGAGANRGVFGSFATITSNFAFHANYYENGVFRGINTNSFVRVNLQTIATGVDSAPISSGTSNPVNDFDTNILIGFDTPSYARLNGTMQELVIFASPQKDNRSEIEKMTNNYYEVY